MSLFGAIGAFGNSVSRLGSDLGISGGSNLPGVTDFQGRLRQASFRGVPFGVLGSDSHFGRRQVVHEYPFRDIPYVEDLGRATRRISFAGFLISDSQIYGGGDVLAQRDRLVAACEAAGPGTLVHPTLGTLTVSLLELGVTERWDSGRVFEIGFTFIESGERVFPTDQSSTGDAVNAAATDADAAASGDFWTHAWQDLKSGAATVTQAVNTAQSWGRQAQQLGNDATNLVHAVSTLQGSFGRYFGGRNRGGFDNFINAVTGSSGSLNALIGLGSVARNNVSGAIGNLNTAASNLGL